MANYFLRTADSTKAYRIDYTVAAPRVTINGCYCTGNGVTLPSGGIVTGVDVPVHTDDVLVDFAVASVAVCPVADYRSIAATVETALATAEVNSYAARW
jgi:hypothetical protein